MPKLRPYQSQLKHDIRAAWSAGARVVLGVAPTGSGKTVLFSDAIAEEPGASCAIAHRKEIVAQISLALARNGVRHRVIGQDKTRKYCQRLHLKRLKRHFIDPNARCAVAGVDTLVNMDPKDPWFSQVQLWVGDEGHHFLRENKWGRAVAMFPSARGLLVTATPCRADGRGLGRAADGMADVMVLGPTMRQCIDMGYLVDYRVACPESDVNVAQVEISKATGDLNLAQLRDAFHKSKRICGDTVKAYQQFTPGKLAIVFNVDVEEATKTARAFRAAGVPAEVVSAETEDDLRDDILRRFEAREILVMCNVDLFGEGFDLPNLDAVIMARHTESFSLYSQQWGRGTRLDLAPEHAAQWGEYADEQRRAIIAASAKPHMWLIDLVGNVVRHNGPPDRARVWSLAARDKRSNGASDTIPFRTCLNPNGRGPGIPCAQAYERYHKCCPYCAFYPEPAGRSSPAMVDGDVLELDAATLEAMRGNVERIDGAAVIPYGQPTNVQFAARKHHHERQLAQAALRGAMAWWAGLEDAQGRTDRNEQYRRFYHRFGIDVLSAMALGRADAEALRAQVCDTLAKSGIDGTVNTA